MYFITCFYVNHAINIYRKSLLILRGCSLFFLVLIPISLLCCTTAHKTKSPTLDTLYSIQSDNLYVQAEEFIQSYNFSDSIPLYQKLLKQSISAHGDYHKDVGILYHKLGEAYYELHRNNKSLNFYEKALKIRKAINDKQGEGRTLRKIGFIYSDLGQNKKALDYYNRALLKAKETNDKQGEGGTLSSIGVVYHNSEKYEQALEYYLRALPLRREANDKQGEAVTLNNIGLVYYNSEKYEQALEYYLRVLPLRREANDKQGEAVTLNDIGLVYANSEKYEQALEYYQRALTIYQELGDRAGAAATLRNIRLQEATILFTQAWELEKSYNYERAIEYYKSALSIFRELENWVGEANVLFLIGKDYASLNLYKKSIDYFEQALAICRREKYLIGQGGPLTNIGAIYAYFDKYEKSIEYFEQAIEIFREVKNLNGEALALGNIGSDYHGMRKYDKALKYYEQALAIQSELENPYWAGETLASIGLLYLNIKQYDKALDYLNQSLTISREVKERNAEGRSLRLIGLVYYNLGHYDKALQHYEQSLAIFRETKNLDSEGRTFYTIMLIWRKLKNPKLAILYGKLSVNANQEIRGKIIDLEKELQKSYLESVEHSYRELADLLIAEGRILEAQQVLDMLKEEEYSQYITRSGGGGDYSQDIKADYSHLEQLWINRYNEIGDKLAVIGIERQKLLKKKNKNIKLTKEEQKRLALLNKDDQLAEAAFNQYTEDLKTWFSKECEKPFETLDEEFKSKIRESCTKQAKGTIYKIKEDTALRDALKELGGKAVVIYTVVSEKQYTAFHPL